MQAAFYARYSVTNSDSPTAFASKVTAIADSLGYDQEPILLLAWDRFDGAIQHTLNRPNNMAGFIDEIQMRLSGWLKQYQHREKVFLLANNSSNSLSTEPR